mgnify:CR=1 FL=1
MKIINKGFRVLILTLILILPSSSIKAFNHENIDVKLIGHRGASAYEPENTIPSFVKAADLGMWGAECDLYSLRDGSLIIFHDNDVDRMTNGVGKIQSMSLVEVKALNIDSGNNIKKYKNLKIPTLDEYLICCKKNKLVPVIEFKDINVNNVKEVVDKIKGYGLEVTVESVKGIIDKIKQYNLEDNTIIISTSYEWIKYIREYSDKIHFQYLSDITIENINLLKEYGNYGIDVRKDRVTAENVRLAHENGAVVNVWDVKTEEEANMLIGIGVDMITSDYKLK